MSYRKKVQLSKIYKKTMVIYKVTCLINNKIYIGLTKNSLHARKWRHLYYAKPGIGNMFHNAIRKHGEQNFIWEVIDEAKTYKELQKRESYWIKKLASNDRKIGYNITLGGGSEGIKRSKKTRKLIGDKKRTKFELVINKLNSLKIKIHLKENKYRGIYQRATFECEKNHLWKTNIFCILQRGSSCRICRGLKPLKRK